MLDQQPLGTDQLRAEAWQRWSQLPRFLDTEVSKLREGLRLGYMAPRRNVELAIGQLDTLLALPIDSSPLSSPMRRDDDVSFRTRWSELVEAELLPATKRYRDFLSVDYAPRARTGLAITGIPRGAECYRAQIRTHTTYPLMPHELYALGEKLVAEREAKALKLARAEFGEGIGDLRAARAALDADPRNRFNSTAEALDFVRQALTRAEQAAPRWFNRVPRAPLTLVPYADFEAKAYPPARYEPAATDGARPARFRIDVTNFEALQRADVERESAVDWVVSKQVAFSAQEAEAYVDRIAVCPGEMLSYGFGERELFALRHEAQVALGPRFDIKTFHDKVLAHGAIPLPLVGEVITQWIRE